MKPINYPSNGQGTVAFQTASGSQVNVTATAVGTDGKTFYLGSDGFLYFKGTDGKLRIFGSGGVSQ
jgi:hypothetical protein